ncbi:MAG TPA: S41 family peptidase [Chthoniobacteraceae bacterium]|nr:S41 family peptidase [Chthoniobacteraceae bacterium]
MAFRTFLAVVFIGCSALAADSIITDGGFEQAAVGAAPPGWFVPPVVTQDGWTTRVVGEEAVEGQRCAVIERSAAEAPKAFGNLMRTLEAQSYRGKRLRFSAQVKNAGASGTRSQLWFRVDRAGEKRGFFDNCQDRPVTTNEWSRVEIVADVAEDAESLAFGLMVFGNGASARLDDVTLEIAGTSAPVEGARALSDRGLDNVVAFARLLGYVRFFHPSDQAAAFTGADWDRFTVAGIREVESAANAAELAARLNALFGPIAPTVTVAAGKSVKPVALPKGRYVQGWQHAGYGSTEAQAMGIYRSARIRKEAAKIAPADGINDPAKPWIRDLGGGVMCSVPLTVYDDGAATLPKVEAPKATAPAASGIAALPPNDRAVRLAAVITAWNIPQHFFPYFDVVRTDWLAMLRESLRAAATDADEEAFYRTLQRLAAALKDGHVFVSGPGAPEEFVPKVRLQWVEEKLCVAQSEVSDLAPGDAVLAIDGAPVAKAVEECLRQISVPSPQGAKHLSAQRVLAGKRGSAVRLEIDPFGTAGKRREISVPRDTPVFQAPRSKRERERELAPGILYLDLEQWTAAEFAAAWPKLEKARGLVFEFRNYPNKIDINDFFGHFATTLLESPQWHIPTVRRPDRDQLTFIHAPGWKLPPRTPLINCPKAFLIDASCISYAESCLGIVEHYKLGALVGGPTIGTNGNVNTIRLPGGYAMSFTGMKVLKNDGTQHHGIGIRPTVPVELTRKALAEGRDEVIERALTVVQAPGRR